MASSTPVVAMASARDRNSVVRGRGELLRARPGRTTQRAGSPCALARAASASMVSATPLIKRWIQPSRPITQSAELGQPGVDQDRQQQRDDPARERPAPAARRPDPERQGDLENALYQKKGGQQQGEGERAQKRIEDHPAAHQQVQHAAHKMQGKALPASGAEGVQDLRHAARSGAASRRRCRSPASRSPAGRCPGGPARSDRSRAPAASPSSAPLALPPLGIPPADHGTAAPRRPRTDRGGRLLADCATWLVQFNLKASTGS